MDSQIISKLQEYFKTQPIKKAWIFGSYARGEENNYSDLDIMVEYECGYRPGLFGISKIMEDLKKLIGKNIDLVEKGFLYPLIAKEVEKQKIEIYERANS